MCDKERKLIVKKRITQQQADMMATEHEEYLHSRTYEAGDEFYEIGKRADFSNCDLSGITFSESFLDKVSFKDANLENCVFKWCSLHDAHFYNANLQGAMFFECTLDNANLMYAICKNAKFIDCDIRGSRLSYSDLRGTELSGTDLSDALLKSVKVDAKADPGKFKNVKYQKVLENEYVKNWLRQQAYIAEFKEYYPGLARIWSLLTNYNRSPVRAVLLFGVTVWVFGFFYSWTDTVTFEKVSLITPYFYSFLNMLPGADTGLIAANGWGEILMMFQKSAGITFLLLFALLILRRFN